MYAIVYASFDFFYRIAKVVWFIEEIKEEKIRLRKWWNDNAFEAIYFNRNAMS